MYLGNQISVDHGKLTVDLNQTEYVLELLERFNLTNCLPVATPMVLRLSALNSCEKLSTEEQVQYRNMVGSLLYLACWSRPDISFVVSELSNPCLPPARTTCKQSSTCSGISRGLANWVCATLSPRTVDQWIVIMSCGGLLTQIGLGAQTAGDPPQARAQGML